jgi:hypothetical protein
MVHYHTPLTFEQKVDVVLEGVFRCDEIRKEVFDKIIDEVRHEFELYKMETNISAVQNVVTLIIYRKIMR